MGNSREAALTAQQQQAVARRHVSIVLSSGAGCGKTLVLTERYLAHLWDEEVDVAEVVAITFTEKAAREMRRRIRKAIAQQVRTSITNAEAERWAGHLRGLESAPISTIHAFCANLLRQFAVDAGLDPRFEILEDVLAGNVETDALADCLQHLLTAKTPAGKDLEELILLYGWKPTRDAVKSLMGAEDPRAWEAWLTRAPEEVAAHWKQFARDSLLPAVMDRLLTGHSKVAECLELLRRVSPRPNTQMAERVGRLLELTPRLAEAADLKGAIAEAVECARVGSDRAKAWPSEAVYEEVKAAFDGFRKELPTRLNLFTAETTDLREAAVVGQRFVRVAAEAARTYRQSKRRQGVVDFQDLLLLTRNLLRDRPDIRERLERRYKVLLIDELQDTDPVQIELVKLLCGEALPAGKLFAVGDHKQSIYRFRGADVHRFQALRRRVPEEGRLGLTVNFRSQPAVIAFANTLLGARMMDYQPLEAHRPQANAGPCVEFLWSPREDKELANEGRATEADWIARRIAAMIAGENLAATGPPDAPVLRPVRPGDIVLLFRAMSNVQLYEKSLRDYGLDYYLVGGRAFFAQQEIYDLLNLLRALENPQDAVSLAGTLRSPFCCLSDESLFLLSRHPSGLWAGLYDPAGRKTLAADQRAAADRASRFLDRWRGLKDRLPIARLLGEVFADSGYDASTQFESLGDRKLANLWKLTDLARTFDRSGRFGLAEFMARLADLVRSQPREEQAATQPESADVVRLMTIHQAKGLEFPVVFIPDVAASRGGRRGPAAEWGAALGCVARPPADEDSPPFPKFAWDLWTAAEELEEWQEELRTLYVACTRAQDYLVLSAALAESYKPANAWMTTLAERFDLRTGACRVPPEVAPVVRVTDVRSPPPTPATSVKRTVRSADAEPVNLAHVGAVPVRPTGGEVVELCRLQRYLQKGNGPAEPGRGIIEPGDFTPPFATEDGADRTAWVTPRQRLDGFDDPEEAAREALLRFVLQRWDFHEPDDWRGLLSRAAEAQLSFPAIGALAAELESPLARFAASPTFRTLGSAVACHRDLEFISTWETGSGRPVCCHGVMDCLWQDGNGDWHLLGYASDRAVPSDGVRESQCREPALILAAQAVSQAKGRWPKSITVYSFADGRATAYPVTRLRAGETAARVTAVLTEFLGRTSGTSPH